MVFSLVASPFMKILFWCSFGEIKIDHTLKKSNILYIFKKFKDQRADSVDSAEAAHYLLLYFSGKKMLQ